MDPFPSGIVARLSAFALPPCGVSLPAYSSVTIPKKSLSTPAGRCETPINPLPARRPGEAQIDDAGRRFISVTKNQLPEVPIKSQQQP